MLKGAYRLLENPAVDPAVLLAGHVQSTPERAQEVPLVLAVQDTTEPDYTHHPATEGLGPIGNGRGRQMLVHATLAITPDRLPLGLLSQQDRTRDRPRRGRSTAASARRSARRARSGSSACGRSTAGRPSAPAPGSSA